MSKIHVLHDENLGGVLREYVEVDRHPKKGDYVYVSMMDGKEVNEIAKVIDNDFDNDFSYETIQLDRYINGEDLMIGSSPEDKFVTLEPTDIVRIKETYEHGKWDYIRYRLVDRKAKVGEKVIVVVANDTLVYRNVGEVVEIIETNGDTFGGLLNPYDLGEKGAIYHFQYTTLEPIDDESPKTTEDLIANLAQRVAELERKLGEYTRKVDGLEADIQNINIDLGTVEENVNKALTDITTLYERTQPLEAFVKAVKSGE